MPLPSSRWHKDVNKNTKGLNGLKGSNPPTSVKNSAPHMESKPTASGIDCRQTQHDEVEVLRSIYMADYEHVEAKGAWSKSADPAFKLYLKSYSDAEVAVVLCVTMTATYPKSLPILNVLGLEGLHPKARESIIRLLQEKPKNLLGTEMIYEIATSIQDMLEDAFQVETRHEGFPSLEDERAVQEAATNKLAREQEEAEQKRKEAEILEEERMLAKMVEDELQRQEAKAKKLSRPPKTNTEASDGVKTGSPDRLIFDRPIHLKGENGNAIAFQSVDKLERLNRGPLGEVIVARPALPFEQLSRSTLVLKQVELNNCATNSSEFKRGVQSLEKELETLKGLRHEGIVDVLDFKIGRVVSGPNEGFETWQVSILTDYAKKGSLQELLATLGSVGSVGVDNVRAWAIMILEALDFYHCNGIVHKDVHLGNVLLWREPSGRTVVKLGDGGYQHRLQHLAKQPRVGVTFSSAKSAYWLAPELAQSDGGQPSRKSDIWDAGVVFLQMMFGFHVLQDFTSPYVVIDSMDLSDTLEEFLRKVFKSDPKKRPTAFDLLPCEFLRSDAPLTAPTPSPTHSRLPSSASPMQARHLQFRRNSTPGIPLSRYANDFVEANRLGKGGFGEVVKARNKLDGRFYAVKKITHNSASSLTEVLSEIMLLSRLNHPYVVRYYTAWLEEDTTLLSDTDEEAISSTEDSLISSKGSPSIDFGHSTGGLDFISSSGYPKIQFGYDSDEESSESGPESESSELVEPKAPEPPLGNDDNALSLKRTRSSSRNVRTVKTTMYIQMEYCEKHTLRDLLRQGLQNDVDASWRLIRQILEGLNHIHDLGIIHRDLKPDNIFIDMSNNPRIGDFGLATSGQYYLADQGLSSGFADGDLTRSIGTALYVAPELKSSVSGHYNNKVDMYSLGIIFFEMCYLLTTAMERDRVLRTLREKEHVLPSQFQTADKAVEGAIINSLISHRPSERPSSAELLRSGKLPVQIESETIQQALLGLSDADSPYHHKMMSALFSQPVKQVKDYTWEMGSTNNYGAKDLLLQTAVKDKLITIFRRHGAVETQRPLLFPRSTYYTANVVQMLDSSGVLVQLPYDLTMPHARAVAKQAPSSPKTFAFGNVYRNLSTGGQPRSHGEVDFDIVSENTLDLALKEAEVIKVIDEVVEAFPSLNSAQMCIHINHSDLLALIMETCRIATAQRPAVTEILSKLNIGQWTWQRIKNELRLPSLGVSATSLDDLAKFDFTDSADKAFQKLSSIFEGADTQDKLSPIFAHMNAVVTYLKGFGIHQKVYVNPLSSFNDKFYKGGLLFQCLYDTKKRDVFAAGGRYDHLIHEHRPRTQGQSGVCHAVGFNLGWEKLYTSMTRLQKSGAKAFLKHKGEDLQGRWNTRRCDVLVASFDAAVLRSAGVKIVQDLWAVDISAELAGDARSPEELSAEYRDDDHSWFVIIKQDTGTFGERNLKVKSMFQKEESEVRSSELMNWLRSEIRDRDQKEGTNERAKLLRQVSHHDANQAVGDREADVKVLVPLHKGKKTNRRTVIENAQISSQEFDGPIAAIDTRDEVFDAIRTTRLSDPDSWRKVIQGVPLAERKYLSQVHELVSDLAKEVKGVTRTAFIYNFRTGGRIYYDLGHSS
ncbi:MAG: hypothetical protein M1812_002249 [Candelaria pacifica]|nr:MAG: hypothetical protein M1812_002249 [Candelaria pacifica]